jgi:hypothetical protein
MNGFPETFVRRKMGGGGSIPIVARKGALATGEQLPANCRRDGGGHGVGD